MKKETTAIDRWKTKFKQTYLSTLLRRPRRFQIFGVGANKTGTHSLFRLFTPTYRSSHEPLIFEVLAAIVARAENRLDDDEYERFIVRHNRQTWLEVHSSHLNYYFLDILVRRFPDAKFVLTVRDCYSWLDSYLNHSLNFDARDHPHWGPYCRLRYGGETFRYTKEEKLLEDRGLFTLDGYFSCWARHNAGVLSTVPTDRLLIVRTDRLSSSAGKLAEFAGVPVSTLHPGHVHSYKATKKHNLLAQLDQDFVRAKADEHCSQLMERFFPDVQWPAIPSNDEPSR